MASISSTSAAAAAAQPPATETKAERPKRSSATTAATSSVAPSTSRTPAPSAPVVSSGTAATPSGSVSSSSLADGKRASAPEPEQGILRTLYERWVPPTPSIGETKLPRPRAPSLDATAAILPGGTFASGSGTGFYGRPPDSSAAASVAATPATATAAAVDRGGAAAGFDYDDDDGSGGGGGGGGGPLPGSTLPGSRPYSDPSKWIGSSPMVKGGVMLAHPADPIAHEGRVNHYFKASRDQYADRQRNDPENCEVPLGERIDHAIEQDELVYAEVVNPGFRPDRPTISYTLEIFSSINGRPPAKAIFIGQAITPGGPDHHASDDLVTVQIAGKISWINNGPDTFKIGNTVGFRMDVGNWRVGNGPKVLVAGGSMAAQPKTKFYPILCILDPTVTIVHIRRLELYARAALDEHMTSGVRDLTFPTLHGLVTAALNKALGAIYNSLATQYPIQIAAKWMAIRMALTYTQIHLLMSDADGRQASTMSVIAAVNLAMREERILMRSELVDERSAVLDSVVDYKVSVDWTKISQFESFVNTDGMDSLAIELCFLIIPNLCVFHEKLAQTEQDALIRSMTIGTCLKNSAPSEPIDILLRGF